MPHITFTGACPSGISPPRPLLEPPLLALFPFAYGVCLCPTACSTPASHVVGWPCHWRCISISISTTAWLRMLVTLMLSSVVHPDTDRPPVSPCSRALIHADLPSSSLCEPGDGLSPLLAHSCSGLPIEVLYNSFCFTRVLPFQRWMGAPKP